MGLIAHQRHRTSVSKDFLAASRTVIDHVRVNKNVDGRHCQRRSLRLKRRGALHRRPGRHSRPMRSFRGRPCVCTIIARQAARRRVTEDGRRVSCRRCRCVRTMARGEDAHLQRSSRFAAGTRFVIIRTRHHKQLLTVSKNTRKAS